MSLFSLNLSLVCLTGFLGQPQDWQHLSNKELGVKKVYSFVPKNFDSFDSFSDNFRNTVKTIAPPRILLGYSLGGRLALHLLLDNPLLWSGAIFISTHPGLQSEDEKITRKQTDAKWAEKFLVEPWEALMEQWESQALFHSSRYILKRSEADFDRFNLAACLKNFSLGLQQDFRAQLSSISLPILWMTGEFDPKFDALTKKLLFLNPNSRAMTIPNSGHRIPWEQPEIFQKAIYSFLNLH